jgi:hypothetical protein
MVICLDYDGVLHDYTNPVKGRRMGPPIEGAREAVERILESGHTVIVFTAWPPDRHHVIREWLRYYEFPHARMTITNVKPADLDLIIDDKAVRFTSWPQIMGYIPITIR